MQLGPETVRGGKRDALQKPIKQTEEEEEEQMEVGRIKVLLYTCERQPQSCQQLSCVFVFGRQMWATLAAVAFMQL